MIPLRTCPVGSLCFTVVPLRLQRLSAPFQLRSIVRFSLEPHFRSTTALQSRLVKNELEKANGMETIRVQ
jgi:hypothetical protein